MFRGHSSGVGKKFVMFLRLFIQERKRIQETFSYIFTVCVACKLNWR